MLYDYLDRLKQNLWIHTPTGGDSSLQDWSLYLSLPNQLYQINNAWISPADKIAAYSSIGEKYFGYV